MRFIFCFYLCLLLCSCSVLNSKPDGADRTFSRQMLEEEIARSDEDLLIIPPDSDSNYFFLLGELAIDDGNYDLALRHFLKASELEKREALILRKRVAQILVRDGKLEQALQELDLAKKTGWENTSYLSLRAGILTALKRSDEAIECYKRMIALDPAASEDPYVLTASIYVQQEKLDEAKAVLKKLVKQNPKSFFGHYYLARLAEAQKEHKTAEEEYKTVLKIAPNAEAVKRDYAKYLAGRGKVQQAIKICREIIQKNPQSGETRNLLGRLLLQDKQVDEAIVELEALEKIEEDPSETRYNIALIKLQKKDFSGAEQELNLILADRPKDSKARYYLATTYAAMKEIDAAIREFRTIEPKQELFLESRMFAAFILRQENRADEAIDFIKEALVDKPKDPKLLSFLAGLYRQANNLRKAIDTMEQLIEDDRERDTYFFTLGVYYDEDQRKEQARAAMNKAIELNPNNANALNYLGYSFAEDGQDLEKALELVKKALAIEPKNGFFIDSLGWIYFMKGDFVRADKELERAIKYEPNDAVILEHLARVKVKIGKLKEAGILIDKALQFVSESDDKEVEARLKKLQETVSK